MISQFNRPSERLPAFIALVLTLGLGLRLGGLAMSLTGGVLILLIIK